MRRSRFIALGEGDALVHPTSWAQDEARLHACDREFSSEFRKILHASDRKRADRLARWATAVHPGALRLDVVLLPLAEVAEHPPHAVALFTRYSFFLGTIHETTTWRTEASAAFTYARAAAPAASRKNGAEIDH